MLIETQRLVLRSYRADDAPRVLEILSHPKVYPWLGDPPVVPMADVDAAEAWVERAAAREASGRFDLFLAIEVRETDQVAGTVLVTPAIRKDGTDHGEHELGWHLHPNSWRHGYAAEAARAMLDHVFAAGLPTSGSGCWSTTSPREPSPSAWSCRSRGSCPIRGAAAYANAMADGRVSGQERGDKLAATHGFWRRLWVRVVG